MPQMMPPMAVILATSAAAVVAMAATPPKTILTGLIDDLGFMPRWPIKSTQFFMCVSTGIFGDFFCLHPCFAVVIASVSLA
jgi:hypothetical protein